MFGKIFFKKRWRCIFNYYDKIKDTDYSYYIRNKEKILEYIFKIEKAIEYLEDKKLVNDNIVMDELIRIRNYLKIIINNPEINEDQYKKIKLEFLNFLNKTKNNLSSQKVGGITAHKRLIAVALFLALNLNVTHRDINTFDKIPKRVLEKKERSIVKENDHNVDRIKGEIKNLIKIFDLSVEEVDYVVSQYGRRGSINEVKKDSHMYFSLVSLYLRLYISNKLDSPSWIKNRSLSGGLGEKINEISNLSIISNRKLVDYLSRGIDINNIYRFSKLKCLNQSKRSIQLEFDVYDFIDSLDERSFPQMVLYFNALEQVVNIDGKFVKFRFSDMITMWRQAVNIDFIKKIAKEQKLKGQEIAIFSNLEVSSLYVETEKPNALFIFPQWGSGAFTTLSDRDLIHSFKDNFDCKIIIAKSENEVWNSIKKNKPTGIFLGGHGDGTRIILGSDGVEDMEIDISDFSEWVKLKKNRSLDNLQYIFLNSCSGAKEGVEKNILSSIHEATGVKTVASKVTFSGDNVFLNGIRLGQGKHIKIKDFDSVVIKVIDEKNTVTLS